MRIKKPKFTKKKFFSFISSLFLFIGIAAVFMRLTAPAIEAAWFDDTYAYRVKLIFTHNATIGDPRAVTYRLDTAELISANMMQSDCDDIRFTDVNGKSLLYDLTGTCNNATTAFEIVFPNIVNGSNIAYAYYGSPNAVNGEIDSTQFTALTPSGGDPSDETAPTTNQEVGPGPILYWKFDEKVGTTAYDSTLNRNNGTVDSASYWKTPDLCASGPCIYFTGGNNRVSKSYSSDTELDPGSGSMTISAWTKRSATATDTDYIVSRESTGGYNLYMNSSGNLCFEIKSGANTDTACSTTTYVDSTWHYITGVKNATTSITLYIDGKQMGQDASISATGSISGSSPTFSVGRNSDGVTTNEWVGFIDEVKYYNYAKSATQVLNEFSTKTQSKGTNASFGDSSTTNLSSNGLMGYWKMDEYTSNLCSGGANDSCDSSGNSNDGLWNGNVAAVSATKYFYGTSYDGTGDYVGTSNNNSVKGKSQVSVSMWIYPTTVNSVQRDIYAEPINADDSNRFELMLDSDNAMYFGGRSTDTNSFEDWADGTTTISANNWYHIVAIYDGVTGKHKLYVNNILQDSFSTTPRAFDNTNPFAVPRIGANTLGTTGFIGRIDEVKLYSRALSANEVTNLYDVGPGPVGYYKLDEAGGTTVTDNASANTGVLTSSPVWVTGKYGQGLKFDGSASYVRGDSPSTNLALVENVTVSAWVYRRVAGANHTVVEYASNGETETTNEAYSLLINSTNNLELNWEHSTGTNDSTVSTATLTTTSGAWIHVAAVRDINNNTVKFYENGVQLGTTVSYTNDPSGSDSSSNRIDIGRDASNGTNYFDGTIDDVRIYNYTLTPKQLAIEMNADHPTVGTPVGAYISYWPFDEGRGTTANDKSLNADNLTLSTSSWTSTGKFFNAWNGLGTNYISRSNDSDYDVDTNSFSISFWFKSDNSGGSGTQYIVNRASSTIAGFAVYGNSSGNIVFGVDDDTSWGPDAIVTSSSNLYNQAWHHIVAVKTDTSRLDLYVDGKLNASTTTGVPTGSLSNDLTLYIGDRDGTDNGDEALVDLDEVKIYSGALSLQDVQVEYNHASQTQLGSLSTSSDGVTIANDTARGYCVPGDTSTCNTPVLELQMDENSGTSAFDTSGNGNTGTLTLGPTWTAGKLGPAVSFDGSDDYITVTDANSLDLTTSGSAMAWVRRTSTGTYDTILGKGAANAAASHNYAMEFTDTNTMDVIVGGGGVSGQTCNDGSTTFTDTTNWHHYAMTWDNSNIRFYYDGKQAFSCTQTVAGTANTAALLIGMFGGSVDNLAGQIDSVKVYNYTRSASQISWDYNQGKSVAYWKFDECQGSTLYDSSGGGYNGTWNGASSGTQTSVGSCNTSSTAWGNGATGKFSSSLNFDGTNDYVEVANAAALNYVSRPFSISVWLNKGSSFGSTFARVVDKISAGTGNGYGIDMHDTTIRILGSTSVGFTYSTSSSTWYHLVATYDGSSTGTLYINGNLVSSGSYAAANAYTGTLRIGAASDATSPFTGKIDEVQIFPYALTARQVKTIYNQNSAIRFGPQTGTP